MQWFSSLVAGTVSLIVLMASALAQEAGQEPFEMIGTWKGDGIVVYSGANPYREPQDASKAGPIYPRDSIEFTFEINRQDDYRFSGQASSGDRVESVIGAINLDNQRAIIIDDDGQYDISIVDADTLYICYRHLDPEFRAVGCFQLTRQ